MIEIFIFALTLVRKSFICWCPYIILSSEGGWSQCRSGRGLIGVCLILYYLIYAEGEETDWQDVDDDEEEPVRKKARIQKSDEPTGKVKPVFRVNLKSSTCLPHRH